MKFLGAWGAQGAPCISGHHLDSVGLSLIPPEEIKGLTQNLGLDWLVGKATLETNDGNPLIPNLGLDWEK